MVINTISHSVEPKISFSGMPDSPKMEAAIQSEERKAEWASLYIAEKGLKCKTATLFIG